MSDPIRLSQLAETDTQSIQYQYHQLHQRAMKLAELAGGDATMHVTDKEWQVVQDYYVGSRLRLNLPPVSSRPLTHFDVPGGKVAVQLKKPPLLDVSVKREPYPSGLPDSGFVPDPYWFTFFVRGQQVEALRVDDEQHAQALTKWFPELLNRLTNALTPLLKPE